jgi:hypothetical protein
MTPAGMIFMALSWALVIGLTVFCLARTLRDR